MKNACVTVAAVLLSLVAIGVATRRADSQAPPAIVTDGDLSIVSVNENDQPVNNGYPQLLRDRAGNLWCVWVSARNWRDGLSRRQDRGYEEGDRIVLRVRRGGQWSDGVIVDTHFGVNFAPVLAEDSAGNIIVVWSSRREGVDGIWWRRVGADLSMGSELRVPAAGRLEGKPSVVADGAGKLWLAFQSVTAAGSDIVFYSLEGSGWRRQADAAASADPELRPRLAAAPDGGVWCAWDAYTAGKYRVMARRFEPATGSWGEAAEAPGAASLDAYAPDLAVDARGQVWVAYARNEVEEHAWGLRGEKKGGAPRPTVRLAVRTAEGWRLPAGAGGGQAGFIAQGDLPRVRVAADGTIWIVWQRLPGHVDWKVGAAAWRDGSWYGPEVFGQDEPVATSGPPRRADQRASLVALDGGAAVFAYERGRGAFVNRDIYLRSMKLAGGAGARGALGSVNEPARVARTVRTAPRREAIHLTNGDRRSLYFGDLHNHVLVDDGHQGSVDQLFAIHRDRFASDFAATTSHGDSNKLLISELAHNDLLTGTMERAGFVTIPGFEWTQGDFVVPRAGHRHVIYETPGGPLYRPTEAHSDSIREFTDLMSKTNGMIFAHHISRGYTGGTDWSYVNIKVEPAVEMCSSWGRFEYYQNPGHIRVAEMRGCSVQDAWRMGWRLGLIGGSDGHNLYGDRIQGLTGVYAKDLTRSGIFEAIRSRHCYATSGEPIQLDFRVDGKLMGSETGASAGPLVEGSVEGTAKLISVEVVKYTGGKYATVYRAPVEGMKAKVWWRDTDFSSSAFYYLRVTQEVSPKLAQRYRDETDNPFPTEMAWSSPVWVDKQ